MAKWRIFKLFLFLAAVFGIISISQSVFYSDEEKPFHTVVGFYQQPKNSMDAVFIGSSNTYEFFQPMFAWKDHGISVYTLATPAMPILAVKYVMREIYKRQPDAVQIITLNGIRTQSVRNPVLHHITDYMPFSLNKVRMIRDLGPKAGAETIWDQMEFYLPMIRFHSKWDRTPSKFYNREPNGYMGSSTGKQFLKDAANMSRFFKTTEERTKLTAAQKRILDDIIDTARSLNIQVLFSFSPQIYDNEWNVALYNSISDYLADAGFPVLNLFHCMDDFNFDLSQDFYNLEHINVHGSVKFTEYISEYLIRNYAFTDKRSNPEYSHWNSASDRYMQSLDDYILDFEADRSPQCSDLPKPENLKTVCAGTDVTLTWDSVEGADGYVIFRKSETEPWARIAGPESSVKYIDAGLNESTQYIYTVVPMKNSEEGPVYGSWAVKGVSVETTIPSPKLKEIWEDNNGITITWEPASDEKDYYIYRNDFVTGWSRIAKDVKTTGYTDKKAMPGVSYAYSVAAYRNNELGEYNPEGLLILREDAVPKLSCRVEGKDRLLTWDPVHPASSFRLEKMLADGTVEAAEEALSGDVTEYTVEDGDVWRLTALIDYGGTVYERVSEEVFCGEK